MGNQQGRAVGGSDVGAHQQEPTSSPSISPARALLESIGLDIYVGAFEVSGYDTVESLQGLTHWDLDRIHRHSHVPILPNHRERILEASCRFSSLLAEQQQQADVTEAVEATQVVSSITTNNDAAADTSQAPQQSAAPNAWALRYTASKSATDTQTKPNSTSSLFTSLKIKAFTKTDNFGKAGAGQADRKQQQDPDATEVQTVIPADFPELQPDSPDRHSSYDTSKSKTAQKGAPEQVNGFRRLLSKRPSKQQQQQHQQEVQLQEDEVPKQLVPSGLEAKDAAALMQAADSAEYKDAYGGAAAAMADKHQLQTPEPATATAAATPQQSTATSSGLSSFTMGKFMSKRADNRHSLRRQQTPVHTVTNTAAATTTAAAMTGDELVNGEGPGDADVCDDDAHGSDSVDNGQAPSEPLAAAAAAAAGTADTQPEHRVAAPTAAGTGSTALVPAVPVTKHQGVLQSLKRVRAKADKQQQQQKQQKHQRPTEAECSGTAAGTLAEFSAAESAADAAAIALDPDSVGGKSITGNISVTASVGGKPGSTEIEPISTADKANIESAAAAAAGDDADDGGQSQLCHDTVISTAGPLTAHKSTLNHHSLKSKLPPIRQQQRKAPTAWSELSSTVTQMAYAVTAPLSAQPLPQPSREDSSTRPAGAWAKLPDRVDSLAYAATAPLTSPRPLRTVAADDQAVAAEGSAAAGAWADLATEVSKMSYAATVLAAAEGTQKEEQQQQQQYVRRSTRLSYAAVQARFADEQGLQQPSSQQQQQQQQQRLQSARSVVDVPREAGVGAGSSCRRPQSAIVSGRLSPGAQQLHEQLLDRLRNQSLAKQHESNPIAAAAAAAGEDGQRGVGGHAAAGEKAAGPLSKHIHATYSTLKAAEVKTLSSGASDGDLRRSGRVHAAGQNKTGGDAATAAEASAQSIQGNALTDQRSTMQVITSGTVHVHLGSTALAHLGSTTAPSSTAGSVISEYSYSTSSKLGGSGSIGRSKAADVQSIVLRAKQRAEARHRLPLPMSPSHFQQQQSAASAASLAAVAEQAAGGQAQGLCDQSQPQQQRSARALFSQEQQTQQQQSKVGVAATVADDAPLLPGQCTSPVFESSSTRWAAPAPAVSTAVAAGAAAAQSIDGERAMRMLQDYRTITELDRKIKARVTQLTASGQNNHKSDSHCSNPTTHALTAYSNSRIDVGSVAPAGHHKQQQQPQQQFGGTDVDGIVFTESRSSRQLNQHGEQPGTSPIKVAVGLLGIREALDNSYDAGNPRSTASTAAPSRYSSAANGGRRHSSSSRQLRRQPDPYHNPFISPVCSPEPIPEQSEYVQYAAAAAAHTHHDNHDIDERVVDDNPFLRESLVLETPATAAAAVAGSGSQQQAQRWLGGAGWFGDDNSNKASGAAAAVDSTEQQQKQQPRDNLAAGLPGRKAVTAAPLAAAAVHDVMPAGAALAGPSLAKAAAAARNVDERIKRILMASRARSAAVKAAAAQQQQQQTDVLKGLAAADQGKGV